jgi:hypothetical protein
LAVNERSLDDWQFACANAKYLSDNTDKTAMMGKWILGSYLAWTVCTALIFSLANPASANAEAPARVFAPPLSPLLLTRSLHRPLPDGKELVIRRSYTVRISRETGGFRVDGALVDVVVEAPPILQTIAEIERKRPDNGLFPIMLDAQGMIIGSSTVQPEGSLDRASRVAKGQITVSGMAAADKVQAQTFLQQLNAQPSRSQWPADVFHPSPGHRSETRAIALQDGNEGHVTIEIETRGAGKAGQLASLERIVTTDLAGNKRVTREQWQLSRIASLPTR